MGLWNDFTTGLGADVRKRKKWIIGIALLGAIAVAIQFL